MSELPPELEPEAPVQVSPNPIRPVHNENIPYTPGYGSPGSGYNEDWEDPYRSLGGLKRPDAYYGAIDFDCPPKPYGCAAPAGEKCKHFVDRLDRDVIRKMPCLSRIQLAIKAGVI